MTDLEVVADPIDDAIELADILSQSIDLEFAKRKPSIRRTTRLQKDMTRVALRHSTVVHALGVDTIYTPQPYNGLRYRTEVLSRLACRIKEEGNPIPAQVAHRKFQETLVEAIGSMIEPPNAPIEQQVAPQ